MINLFELLLFVDWMGKSEMDEMLSEMREICIEHIKNHLEDYDPADYAVPITEMILITG